MEKKLKQASRKRKVQMPEEDDKKNELILEEVQSISVKNAESTEEEEEESPPPARLKRSAKNTKVSTPVKKSKDTPPDKKSKDTPPDKKSKDAAPDKKTKDAAPDKKTKDTAPAQPKKSNTKRASVSPPSLPSPKKKKSPEKEKEDPPAAVNEVKTSTLERGVPVLNLPDGWRREAVVRKTGKTAGQIDIYFYSPDGQKLRSRPDIASYLSKEKMNINIENFDFSKAVKSAEPAGKKKITAENNKSSVDTIKVPPDADEKNDDDAKPKKALVRIFPKKPKKSRK